jgi:ADP-heptose:LPS heptosyltransferase
LKFLNIKTSGSHKLELYLSGEDKDWAAKFLQENDVKEGELLIGIAPGGGASWGKDAVIKHWPAENFAKIADKCIEKFKAKILVLGDYSDFNVCNQVSQAVKGRVTQVCGKTDLGQFIALLSCCRLVVTNDGGPLHMAVAVGAKTISIFGPVNENVYGPFPKDRNRHIVIKKELECSPCYKKFRMPDCKSRVCLADINPEEVFKAIEELI